LCAFDDDKPIGFASVKVHNESTAEVYAMYVLPAYLDKGIDRNLIWKCVSYCKDHGQAFLTVKTMETGSTAADEYAINKPDFYSSIGFKPIETLITSGDENSPCLLMAMYIS
jgi:GNAT superfamily N-acetyltransferase